VTWLSILSLILSLVDGLVGALIKNNAPAEIIAAAQAALAALQKVEGSPVTSDQLQSMKFTPFW